MTPEPIVLYSIPDNFDGWRAAPAAGYIDLQRLIDRPRSGHSAEATLHVSAHDGSAVGVLSVGRDGQRPHHAASCLVALPDRRRPGSARMCGDCARDGRF
jgi:hypothetical protein